MHIDFSRGKWEDMPLTYAYPVRFHDTPRFTQKDDCVESKEDPSATYGFENIPVLTCEKFGVGTKITIVCEFEKLGAPLLTLAEGLFEDKNGNLRYSEYYEMVIYKDGVNIWRHYTKDEKPAWHLVLGAQFTLSDEVRHTFGLTIRENYFDLFIDEKNISLRINDMAPGYHVGPTSCEGINRFYTLNVE